MICGHTHQSQLSHPNTTPLICGLKQQSQLPHPNITPLICGHTQQSQLPHPSCVFIAKMIMQSRHTSRLCSFPIFFNVLFYFITMYYLHKKVCVPFCNAYGKPQILMPVFSKIYQDHKRQINVWFLFILIKDPVSCQVV